LKNLIFAAIDIGSYNCRLTIVKKFKDNTDNTIFTTASRIISGHNSNEVLLNSKINKKQGFFERFFNFFD